MRHAYIASGVRVPGKSMGVCTGKLYRHVDKLVWSTVKSGRISAQLDCSINELHAALLRNDGKSLQELLQQCWQQDVTSSRSSQREALVCWCRAASIRAFDMSYISQAVVTV